MRSIPPLPLPLLLGLVACRPSEGGHAASCDPEDIELATALERVFLGEASACEVAAYEEYVDGMVARGRGPWSGDIRSAWSPDGLAFDLGSIQSLRLYANVPEVRLHEGVYHLFWVDGDLDRFRQLAREGSDWFTTHGLGPFGALRMATSTDGVGFELVEEFTVEGLPAAMVVDPDVIQLPDGRWRLYYLAVPLADAIQPSCWEEGAQHSVRFAESDDLVHWEDGGEAVSGPFADPTVRCQPEGGCLMMSYGLDDSFSQDGGVTFEYRGGNEIFGFAPEFLDVDGRPTRLYVSSRFHGAPIVSYTLDPEGRWLLDEGERLPDFTGEAPSLAPAPQGGWTMYYQMDWNVEGWDDTGA